MGIRVVTLPPGLSANDAVAFARRARRQGADRLELRTDLHVPSTDAHALREALALIVAERGVPVPSAWRVADTLVDRPSAPADIVSWHAEAPLLPADALARWRAIELTSGALLKHVEPLGSVAHAGRLLETQALLRRAFGPRVTVLATGPLALPFRALLAEKNALDYLALDGGWAATVGQRRLQDAVRADQMFGGTRRGILGSGIAHARSPRVHAPPFDRLDLPPDADLAPLLAALHPFYAGFAVTSPFKAAAALLAESELAAVNTLRRIERGYEGFNTDVDGALAALARLRPSALTALGDGGATAALRHACERLSIPLRVVRQRDVDSEPLAGDCFWTWPLRPASQVPRGLRFARARVALCAYGPPARAIAAEIRARGGVPVSLGPTWFIAQARAQRRIWDRR